MKRHGDDGGGTEYLGSKCEGFGGCRGRRRERWGGGDRGCVFGGDMAWTDTCANVRRDMKAEGADFS